MKYSSSSCASVNDKETDIRNKRERFNYKTIFFDGTLQNNFFHLFDLVIKNDFFNLGRRGGGIQSMQLQVCMQTVLFYIVEWLKLFKPHSNCPLFLSNM